MDIRPIKIEFPQIVPIVKSQAEKYFNVVRFNEFPRGGHFAIHEQAPVLARDIREFFRPLRETTYSPKEI